MSLAASSPDASEVVIAAVVSAVSDEYDYRDSKAGNKTWTSSRRLRGYTSLFESSAVSRQMGS